MQLILKAMAKNEIDIIFADKYFSTRFEVIER